MILLAGVTGSIHFTQLVVIRRLEPQALSTLSALVALPWKWPSVAYALDLFAWDLFFGLSMLSAASIFHGGKLETITRRMMSLSGALCIVGLLGPALGDLRFQLIAITGYAGLGPLIFVLLSQVLSRARSTAD